jgi:hypothetical protein
MDDWVRSVYRYRDESEELLKDPSLAMDEVIQRGWFDGDCDDISMFYAALLRPIFPLVRFVAIRYKPENPEFTHVFTEFNFHGTYVRVDPTVQPGTMYQELERMVEYV